MYQGADAYPIKSTILNYNRYKKLSLGIESDTNGGETSGINN